MGVKSLKAGAPNHSVRAHALLSPSSSDRWLNCTPSVRLEERSGIADKGSDASKEGTLAHEYSETLLRLELGQITDSEADKRLAVLKTSKYYAPEMHEYAYAYVDKIMERVDNDPRAVVIVEARVDYSAYVTEGTGSTDSTTHSKATLFVDDFKYGKGHSVSAVKNSQLMLYAVGAFIKMGKPGTIRKIVLTIHQPRLDNFSTWQTTITDLMLWALEYVKPRAKLAWEGKGELNAGAWCLWCKVAPKCRAQAAQSLEVARHEFRDPALLTDKEILKVYALVKPLEAWIKAVKGYVLEQALKGKSWEGYKLVHSRSNRTITDDAAVLRILKREGYTRDELVTEKLIGVVELEKLLGKPAFNKLLGRYVIKPEGAPALTDENDKRAGLGLESAINDFKDLNKKQK